MSHLVPDLIDANESDLWLPANSVMVCHLISSQLYTGSFVVPADWLQGVCCVMQDLWVTHPDDGQFRTSVWHVFLRHLASLLIGLLFRPTFYMYVFLTVSVCPFLHCIVWIEIIDLRTCERQYEIRRYERQSGVSVCITLKVREASLNLMRHWTGSQWSSRSVSTDNLCDGFCVTTLAAVF